MKQSIFTLIQNTPLTTAIHELKLRGDCSAITAPGQFVQVSVPGKFLRRPFSVCDCEGDVLTLCVRKAGAGTETLCAMEPGAQLDLLTGLGNGFDTRHVTPMPLLIGGGSGVGALYGLAKALCARGKIVTAALGFRTASEVYYVNQFQDLGADVYVYTEDGSRGGAGLASDAVGLPHSETFASGRSGCWRASTLWKRSTCSSPWRRAWAAASAPAWAARSTRCRGRSACARTGPYFPERR